MNKGTLYIISTPIGNLEDMTYRGVRILREVDVIAAEDTRRASILLNHYGITAKVISFHSYNSAAKTPGIIKRINDGQNVALISDSGTPGISDPGHVLIRECIKKEIDITAAPGPAAFVVALVLSGLAANKFVFEGFLSNKGSRRRKRLLEIKDEKRTVIFYESPHRLVKLIADIEEVFGDPEIAVARELTKRFEEIKRGTAGRVRGFYEKNPPKGEIVVLINPENNRG